MSTKTGCGSHRHDCEHRRDERVGRRDHLVAGTNLEGAQRQLDRREAGTDPDRVTGADIGGELGFEALDRGPHDEIPSRDQVAERRARSRR